MFPPLELNCRHFCVAFLWMSIYSAQVSLDAAAVQAAGWAVGDVSNYSLASLYLQ